MADFVLEIVEGSQAGRQVALDSVVDIGRDPSLPLALEHDTQASRRHARVTAQAGQAVLEDLGSTNGTYVNDQVIHSARLLRAGDRIRVGLTVIELRSRGDLGARPSAVQPRPAITALGDAVLAPAPESELARVSATPPSGPLGTSPVAPPPPPVQVAQPAGAPALRAELTPAAFVPPEVVGDAQAESDYEAIARLVDHRVKQQRNVAVFAMLALAALAVIIYFGVS